MYTGYLLLPRCGCIWCCNCKELCPVRNYGSYTRWLLYSAFILILTFFGNLYFQGPPIFEAGSIPRMISVTAGQDFTINCRVTKSYPPNPTITLTEPGSVPTDVTANPSQIFRQNQAGTYMYVCRADNTRATLNLTYQVTVTMSPSRSCLSIMVKLCCYFSKPKHCSTYNYSLTNHCSSSK